MRIHKLLLFSTLLLVTTIIIVLPKGCEQDMIKIGYIGSFSGKYSAQGVSSRDGALLAVEEINKNGGINGKKIELLVRDDGGVPEEALKAAKWFYNHKVKFIIGPFTSSSATKVLPFINQKKILTIGPVVSGANLAGLDDYFIRLNPSTMELGKKLANLSLSMGFKRAAAICDYNNRKYSENFAISFGETINAKGGIFAGNVSYNTNSPLSYSEIAEKISDMGAECVLIVASPLDSALFCQKLKDIRQDIQVFGSAWSISKELLENGSDAIEGMFFYLPFDNSLELREFKAFKKKFEKRFKKPISYTAQFNFEAVVTVAEKMEIYGQDVDAVKRGIIGQTHKGVGGDFYINKFGDVKRPLILHTIKNGIIVKSGKKK